MRVPVCVCLENFIITIVSHFKRLVFFFLTFFLFAILYSTLVKQSHPYQVSALQVAVPEV